MAKACCETNLITDAPSDGYAEDGEIWICPACGTGYEHVCDEASGCQWSELEQGRTTDAL